MPLPEININPTSVIREIAHGSSEYWETIEVRDQVLRKPLGLEFTPAQLKEEFNCIHLAYLRDEKIIACLVLKPHDMHCAQMKQVAVLESFRGSGIGKELVLASEEFGRQYGFSHFFCHARDTAIPFYLKLGYIADDHCFTEVGIPHQRLDKSIMKVLSPDI